MTKGQLFTKEAIGRCVKRTSEMVSSAVERARTDLDTTLFVAGHREARRVEEMLSRHDLTPHQRGLVIVWPLDPDSLTGL